MSKTLIAILFLFVGCATKKYVNPGEPNFEIAFKQDSSFYENIKVEVDIYEFLPNCKFRILGAVYFKKIESRLIAIDVDRKLGVQTTIRKSSFFSNTKFFYSDNPFWIVPKKGEKYKLEVEYDDGATGRNFYQLKGSKKIELKEAAFYPECANFTKE